ncbi:hypothetical protein HHK36_023418 [Tetracentron sinense]|uniref:X8 domain-containing protein n=1 Tax=Tetracentron sinense TaxID=13715 RepID=A0A834YSB9_TETSI|nr:hypothetical protein HHK36_023418 [Tetracentron sinense]
MGIRIVQCLIFFLLGLLLCSGSSVAEKPWARAIKHNKELNYEEIQELFSSSKSITQLDVTTPIINPTATTPTIPVINPITTPTAPTVVNPVTPPTAPTYTNPITPPTPPTTMNPITPPTPPTTTTPVSSGGEWCIASPSASQTALQVALDYACGYGGADCSAIQPSGSCYNPNTLRDHASYAFNDYYHKNPAPTSCNFGGTAMVTTTDPSSGSCQYASTSSSSSVVNGTNPSGNGTNPSMTIPSGPTAYGSEPTGSINSAISMSCSLPLFFILTCLLVAIIPVNRL